MYECKRKSNAKLFNSNKALILWFSVNNFANIKVTLPTPLVFKIEMKKKKKKSQKKNIPVNSLNTYVDFTFEFIISVNVN